MQITNTNILVDGFILGKKRKTNKYIFFLTHMHSDHYMGLTKNFELGPVFSSKVTQ
jgi:ribonuclease BN (tRNA processing enzyme)